MEGMPGTETGAAVDDLPGYRRRRFISCWRLGWRERIRIVFASCGCAVQGEHPPVSIDGHMTFLSGPQPNAWTLRITRDEVLLP